MIVTNKLITLILDVASSTQSLLSVHGAESVKCYHKALLLSMIQYVICQEQLASKMKLVNVNL